MTEFDEHLWLATVEKATVYSDERVGRKKKTDPRIFS